MRYLPAAVSAFLLCVLSAAGPVLAAPNADIFPAEAAAQNAIHWKDGYFDINGQPTMITSGEMHYARIPRQLWADRIWRAKQMGLNCLQMYVFWNATEGKEGQWDFSDNLDLDAYLTLIQKMGMYAIVRVGPYSCAEWESGGFPAWLTTKPGMTLRNDGPFMPYSDLQLAKVEQIVARHQINHGGNVIMAQLENEDPHGWGMDERDPYLKHLVEQARANGLEIPVFLSGLHHGNSPAGEHPFIPGASPWFTTEFWSGWIGKYGDMQPGMLDEKVSGTWKIIAFGGAGYDYYMVHGGTNFGYSGFSHDATYDYSAPIGEAGQLRNFYFPARRAALFAQSFSSLLTGSHDDPGFARSDLPGLRVTTRTNPAGGSMVMVDNFDQKVDKSNLPEIPPSANAYQAPSANQSGVLSTRITAGGLTLPRNGSLKVAAAEPRTVLMNIPWTANTSFKAVCTNVLLRRTLGGIDYWVCYGAAGDTGEVILDRKTGAAPSQLDFTYPAGNTVNEIPIDSGDGSKAMLLVMNTDTTDKTWLANDKLYIGPSFVLEDGSVEFPPEGGSATVYSVAGKSTITGTPGTVPGLPALASWTWRDAAPERDPAFDIATWGKSVGPQAIGTYDSFQNRYGWYRTVVHSNSGGSVALHFSGESGTFIPYLNGQPASLAHLDMRPGDNTLSILASVGPRPTLYSFTGLIGTSVDRGLWGSISTDPAPTAPEVAWKQWTGKGNPGNGAQIASPSYDDSSWKSAGDGRTGTLRLGKGNSWFRGAFTLDASQVDSSIQIPDFGGQSIVYLNGQQLVSSSQDVSRYLVAGANTVVIEVQSRKGASGNLALDLWHNSPAGKLAWYFHGGLNGLDETPIIGRVTNWSNFLASKPWQPGEPSTPAQPTFWHTTFTYQHPAAMRETIGLMTNGLKAGHVWLNGHNLGECPQSLPMYMPECWLNDGNNDLVIFDLYGSKPGEVSLQRYEAHELADK